MTKYRGHGAVIEVDDDVLTLTKEGVSAKLVGSTGSRKIPTQAVIGVNFKDATRLVNGWLQIVLAGEPLGTANASDPNTILFRHKSQRQFEELRDHLLAVIDDHTQLGFDSTAVGYDPAARTRLQALEEQRAARHARLAERRQEAEE